MKAYKVAVIGGGIVGVSVFNELVRKGVSACLLEAGDDVAGGATRANSGIVHSGYDPEPGSLMAELNVKGNKMYADMCKRVGVKFFKYGTLTVANKSSRAELERLINRGKTNGVKNLQLLDREDILEIEPNIADNIEYALYAPSGGYVSPYLLCIALAEEAVVNGGKLFLNFCVDNIQQNNGKYILMAGEQSVEAEYVVNCAGANAVQINKLLGDTAPTCNYIKGEYVLLSREQHNFVKRPIFALPSIKGKGVLCTPTEHNVMFGPTANCTKADDTAVDLPSLDYVKQQAMQTVKNPPFNKAIKLFAGVRVKAGFDFVINRSRKNQNFYYAIGICSPGLTAAPAIAKMITDMLHEDGVTFRDKVLIRHTQPIPFASLSTREQKTLVKKNPSYAKIICRCERITEGEIVDALRSPITPTSVDAIKRRVRATMGRCQGGFCLPHILKIMARELKKPINNITLKGEGSEIISGEIKQGGFYE